MKSSPSEPGLKEDRFQKGDGIFLNTKARKCVVFDFPLISTRGQYVTLNLRLRIPRK